MIDPGLAFMDFGLEAVVETAQGPLGLVIVSVYSFLIAFILPGVSEVVLLVQLNLGLPRWLELSAIVLVSSMGKAAGSLLAFHIGQEAKRAGPVVRLLERSRFDVMAASESAAVRIARKYGYLGLAGALCVPGFPDTISLYAFAILEEDYLLFAAATFVGSIGRLVLTLAGIEVVLAII
jgi:membrane protein YqaA with SNARE-associated domain